MAVESSYIMYVWYDGEKHKQPIAKRRHLLYSSLQPDKHHFQFVELALWRAPRHWADTTARCNKQNCCLGRKL